MGFSCDPVFRRAAAENAERVRFSAATRAPAHKKDVRRVVVRQSTASFFTRGVGVTRTKVSRHASEAAKSLNTMVSCDILEMKQYWDAEESKVKVAVFTGIPHAL